MINVEGVIDTEDTWLEEKEKYFTMVGIKISSTLQDIIP